jgi:hypothetical protein
MTTEQKFERKIKKMDRIGRDLYGMSYVSFWRFMYFLRRSDIVIDRDRLNDMQVAIGAEPEQALMN